jgi:hypothetical protein
MSRDRRPPGLAAWMLLRILRAPRCEALIGDLAEEYRHGRSRTWYWRQTLWAIAADLREHPPRRLGLGALRLAMIATLLLGASLGAKWPLFIFALDPIWWWFLGRRRRARHRGQEHPRGDAPCDR